MRFALISPIFVLFGLLFLFWRGSPEISSCDRCLYNSCSSSFLLLSCGEIQNNNIDTYFNSLKNVPDELNKILVYSQMYGKNMGECFSNSRSYCRHSHCSEECGESSRIQSTENTVTEKDNETLAWQDTRIINYMVESESCYVQELNVREMWTACILSPFRDDCTGSFSRNASRRCRGLSKTKT